MCFVSIVGKWAQAARLGRKSPYNTLQPLKVKGKNKNQIQKHQQRIGLIDCTAASGAEVSRNQDYNPDCLAFFADVLADGRLAFTILVRSIWWIAPIKIAPSRRL